MFERLKEVITGRNRRQITPPLQDHTSTVAGVDSLFTTSAEQVRRLNNINLDLKTEPLYDNLSLLIQSPEEPCKYYIRRVSLNNHETVTEVIPYNLGLIQNATIKRNHLLTTLAALIKCETSAAKQDTTKKELLPGTVAIVSYQPDMRSLPTIDEIAILAGKRYLEIKTEYDQKRMLNN